MGLERGVTFSAWANPISRTKFENNTFCKLSNSAFAFDQVEEYSKPDIAKDTKLEINQNFFTDVQAVFNFKGKAVPKFANLSGEFNAIHGLRKPDPNLNLIHSKPVNELVEQKSLSNKDFLYYPTTSELSKMANGGPVGATPPPTPASTVKK